MSGIGEQIGRMRAKADFLARHEVFIDQHSYQAAWDQAEFPDSYPEGVDRWQWFRENGVWIRVVADWYNNVDFEVEGDPTKVKQLIATLRRHLGGLWEKDASSSTFRLRQEVEVSGVELCVTIEAERSAVCKAVVTGTRTVEKRDPEKVAALQAQINEIETVPVEEDVVEWQCAPILTEADGIIAGA